MGEAATQPTVRLPPLREGRHAKLFAAAMAIRFSPDNGSLPPGDAFVIMDGGREGISPCIVLSFNIKGLSSYQTPLYNIK